MEIHVKIHTLGSVIFIQMSSLWKSNFENVYTFCAAGAAHLSFMQGESVVEMLKSFKNFPCQNQLLAVHHLWSYTFFILCPGFFLIGYPSHGCKLFFWSSYLVEQFNLNHDYFFLYGLKILPLRGTGDPHTTFSQAEIGIFNSEFNKMDQSCAQATWNLFWVGTKIFCPVLSAIILNSHHLWTHSGLNRMSWELVICTQGSWQWGLFRKSIHPVIELYDMRDFYSPVIVWGLPLIFVNKHRTLTH